MQNIKWKNVGIAGLVLLFIVGAILYQTGVLNGLLDKNNTQQVSNTNNQTVNNNQTQTVDYSTVTLQDVKTVDNASTVGITAPPEPTNGKVRSVTMIGPSGIYNSIVLTDGKNYKRLKKGFVQMLINEGNVSTEDIKKVVDQFVNDSWNNGVNSKGDVQLVIASSVVENPKIKEALPELNRKYSVTLTTSNLEGAGAFKVAVAPQYYPTATVVDMTPTIIRFTYLPVGTNKPVTIVAKTGTKYYQNNQTDQDALNEIRRVVGQIPQTNKQQFIVLWAAAEKDLRQGENRYAPLPNYNGGERMIKTGLTLVNEVKVLTNGNVFLDFDSMWFSGF